MEKTRRSINKAVGIERDQEGMDRCPPTELSDHQLLDSRRQDLGIQHPSPKHNKELNSVHSSRSSKSRLVGDRELHVRLEIDIIGVSAGERSAPDAQIIRMYVSHVTINISVIEVRRLSTSVGIVLDKDGDDPAPDMKDESDLNND